MSRSTCWLRVHGFPSSSRSIVGLVPVVRARARSPTRPNSPNTIARTGPVPKRRSSQQPNSANSSGVATNSTAWASALPNPLPRRLALAELHQRTFPHRPDSGHTDRRTLLETLLVNLFAIYGRRFLTGQTEVSPIGRLSCSPSPLAAARELEVDAPPVPGRSPPVGWRGPLQLLPGDPHAGVEEGEEHQREARPATNGHERVALLRVGRAAARRPRAARSTPRASRPCGAGRGRGA